MAARVMASVSITKRLAHPLSHAVTRRNGQGAHCNLLNQACSPFTILQGTNRRVSLSLGKVHYSCKEPRRLQLPDYSFGKRRLEKRRVSARPQAIFGDVGNESLWEGDQEPQDSLFARVLDQLQVPEAAQKGLSVVVAFGSAVCVLLLHYNLISIAGVSLLNTWRGTWASLMTGGSILTTLSQVGSLVSLAGVFFMPYLVPHPFPAIILAFPGLLAFMDYKRRWVDWALCAVLSLNFLWEVARALWAAKQARDVGILSEDVSYDAEEGPEWVRRLLTAALPFVGWQAWTHPSLSGGQLSNIRDEFDLRGVASGLLFVKRNVIVYSAPVIVYLARMYFRATTRGVGIVIAPYFFLNAWWVAPVLGVLQVLVERWRLALQRSASPVQFKLGVRSAPDY